MNVKTKNYYFNLICFVLFSFCETGHMAPAYKLTYFPVTALGEPIRFMLSYLDIKFEDFRFKLEQWHKLKPNMPFGRVPVLEIDGKQFHQSVALTRFLGKKANLTGKDEWEDLNIDTAADTFTDFNTAIIRWYEEENENARSQKRDELFRETVPFYLERFDKLIKENGGYLANGKLSWADIYFVAASQYANHMLDFKITDKHPNIKALHDKVVEIPKIKAWIEKRPNDV